MEIKSILLDKRIESYNVMAEIEIGAYLNFAFDIIDKNEFQRRKVIKTKIREILKEDLQKGCLIPSIVLASYGKSINQMIFSEIKQNAKEIIDLSIKNREILIIDGLQRTYVMLALREELENRKNEAELVNFLGQKIRVEVYLGLKRMGLLYRMITLNTGQTTMSTRHLMEILYYDYIDVDLGGIILIPDKDNYAPAMNTSEFNFKEILDGFNSYIEKDEGLINRTEILDNIKSLDILKDEVNTEKDLFKDFIFVYKSFLDNLNLKSNNWQLNVDYFKSAGMEIKSNPFGKNVLQIFKRSQAITGFGAAIGQLKEIRGLNFESLNTMIQQINTENSEWESSFSSMIAQIDVINTKSKKIGNDQRYYFRIFFRALLNTDSDQYLNFIKAADYAFNRTREERL